MQALLDEVDIGRTQTSYVEHLRRQLYNEGKIQEDLRWQVTELSGQVINLRTHVSLLELARVPQPLSTPRPKLYAAKGVLRGEARRRKATQDLLCSRRPRQR